MVNDGSWVIEWGFQSHGDTPKMELFFYLNDFMVILWIFSGNPAPVGSGNYKALQILGDCNGINHLSAGAGFLPSTEWRTSVE